MKLLNRITVLRTPASRTLHVSGAGDIKYKDMAMENAEYVIIFDRAPPSGVPLYIDYTYHVTAYTGEKK